MGRLNKDEISWIKQALVQEPSLQGKSVRFQHYRPGHSYGFANAVIKKGDSTFLVKIFIDKETNLTSEMEAID